MLAGRVGLSDNSGLVMQSLVFMSQSARRPFEFPELGPGPEPVSNAWKREGDVVIDRLLQEGVVERLAPDTYRFNMGRLGGSGTQTTYIASDTMSIRVIDAVLPNHAAARLIADVPLLQLRASLSCNCTYTVPGAQPMEFNRPEIVLVYLPQGAEIRFDMAASRQHGVQVYAHASHFLDLFGLRAADVPPALRAALEGNSDAARLVTLPMDARLGTAIEAMTQPIRSPAMLQLFMRGKVQELVALMLDAALRTPGFAGAGGLRQRDIDLAYEARRLLDIHYASPPHFPELAHRIGTNQNKLKVLFRQVFGTTMADYCVQRRIRIAQALLLEGRLSIGEISERVGYEHQSSFTSAFQRRVGMTPREYQQQRAALDVTLPPQAPSQGVRLS